MKTYIVKSGQNIFDVAMTLHGSVEGVFDLLLSNDGLTFRTELQAGMVLNYHAEFVVNDDIASWFVNNSISVKNGHRRGEYADIQSVSLLWLYMYHPSEYDSLISDTEDTRQAYLSKFFLPRMIINQVGVECAFTVWVKAGTYLVVDWGDNTAPQIVDNGDGEIELMHSYKSGGNHEIHFYGNFSLYTLDFTDIVGVYYLLEPVTVDNFSDSLNIQELKTLFQK